MFKIVFAVFSLLFNCVSVSDVKTYHITGVVTSLTMTSF